MCSCLKSWAEPILTVQNKFKQSFLDILPMDYSCLCEIVVKHWYSTMLFWSPDATASLTQADNFTLYGIFISASYRCMFFLADFVYVHDNYSLSDWYHKVQIVKTAFTYIFLTVDHLHLFFFLNIFSFSFSRVGRKTKLSISKIIFLSLFFLKIQTHAVDNCK